MGKRRVTIGVVVLCLLYGLTASAKESTRNVYWPVNSYLASDSVLATYYRHFISYYGNNFADASAAFKNFCQRLRTSDLLADQFNRIGVPTRQIFATLQELESTHFAPTERNEIRRKMLAIDFALETIEGAITVKNRAEFRREVIAEIPPITSNG